MEGTDRPSPDTGTQVTSGHPDLTGVLDVIDVLADDHRAVEDLFVEWERLGWSWERAAWSPRRVGWSPRRVGWSPRRVGWSPQRHRDLVDIAVAELTRHMVAEEQYLYPAVRRCPGDGDELADRALAEHREIERLMTGLMGTDVEHPAFGTLVARLILQVRQHVRAEESVLFPRLRAECEPDELVELGTGVLSAKKLAPTRPHPSISSVSRNKLVGPLVGPLVGLADQAADALTDRPTTLDEL
jgi:hemerythrin superfamily protein